ncbi:hypothetical protein ABLN72_14540 [Mycobacterium tuberculosis]
MTINYQFGDVDDHGAMIRAQAGLLEAEHQAIIRDVLTAVTFRRFSIRFTKGIHADGHNQLMQTTRAKIANTTATLFPLQHHRSNGIQHKPKTERNCTVENSSL